ncbi:MAG: TolB family protein, partial [Gaiellales bacterium]
MRPRDHLREELISGVCISPDGRWVAFVQRVVRGRADRSGLWRVAFEGGAPVRLSDGTWTDSHPRFSPDGRRLAFLSDRSGGVAQVWLMPAEGGRPRCLTRFRRGVSEFDWAPDGGWLA